MAFNILRAAMAGLLALSACAALDQPQQSYTARNGLRVFQYQNGQFEVLALPGTSGSDYFCAAGEYARVMRNARAAERVVVTGVDGPSRTVPRGRSMVFKIGPPGPRTEGLVTTVPMRRLGASFTVAASQQFCVGWRGVPSTF